jgi:beta-lactam-binding protein with PASTA domain
VDYSDESEEEPDSDREKQQVVKPKPTAWTTLPEK